jgi:hypothetical protein
MYELVRVGSKISPLSMGRVGSGLSAMSALMQVRILNQLGIFRSCTVSFAFGRIWKAIVVKFQHCFQSRFLANSNR